MATTGVSPASPSAVEFAQKSLGLDLQEKTVVETSAAAEASLDETAPPSACLLTIPPEVQALIWTRVDKTTISPICKALLHDQRSILFKDISIGLRSSYDRLVPVLTREGGPGCLVRMLKVTLGPRSLNGIKLAQIQQLFKALPGVKAVHVTLIFAQVILSQATAQTLLRNMATLTLLDPYTHQLGDQWRACSYHFLDLYPSLNSLSTALTKKPNQGSQEGAPQTATPHSLENIKTFTLHGPLDSICAPLLVQSFPNLERLRLLTQSDVSIDFAATLEKTTSSLRYLEIKEINLILKGLGTHSLIDKSISRFPHLEGLILDTSQFSSAVFRHLKDPLPLRRLEFGGRTIQSLHQNDIKNLIQRTSSTRNSSLNEIVLNVVHGSIGESTGEDDLDDEGYPTLEDWIMPEWARGRFDYHGMVEIRNLGAASGVQIKGTAVAALDVQDAADEQMAMAEVDNIRHWKEKGGKRSMKMTALFALLRGVFVTSARAIEGKGWFGHVSPSVQMRRCIICSL